MKNKNNNRACRQAHLPFALSALAALLLWGAPVHAADANAATGDDHATESVVENVEGGDAAEFAELLNVMSEETDVATRTKMNSDFVPGIVTVLDGEKMAAMGARTVLDALTFVPGVQAGPDARGIGTTQVRGIFYPFNNGNILVMLNGVPVSRDSAGVNSSALGLPINQVERIEFVRGPGSVVYGEFALQGLVNIVTQGSGSAVTLSGDDRQSQGIDLRAGDQIGGMHLAANYSEHRTEETLLPIGAAVIPSQRRFASLSAKGHGLSLSAQGLEREQPRPIGYDDDSWSIQAAWETALTDALDLRLRSQYLVNEVKQVPTQNFDGNQVRSGAELLWRGWTRQAWLAGIEYSDGVIKRGGFVAPGAPPRSIGKHDREVLGIVLQDQVEISDSAQMTLGARWDDNSEVGERVTPRAALAWRPADHHILKLQYAEGYRSPTFFELYGQGAVPALDFEVNATSEINYVFQQAGTTARATVYHTKVSDMVFISPPPPGPPPPGPPPPPPPFANIGHAESTGLELELSRQVSAGLRVDANGSLSNSSHNRNPQLADRGATTAPDWMTTLGLLWTPVQDNLLGMQWHHVGPRATTRGADRQFDQVNLAYTRRNLVTRGLDLRLGVSNALEDRLTYVSANPVGDTVNAFEFRTAWLELTLRTP